jgi:glutathione S-transferase
MAAVLTETRAICTYLEGLYPEPNLMGRDFEERAFIEMADRRIELYLLLPVLPTAFATPTRAWRRWSSPQFPDFGHSQGVKVREVARWLDRRVGQPSPVCRRRALHHCRHHHVLCSGVCPGPDEVCAW